MTATTASDTAAASPGGVQGAAPRPPLRTIVRPTGGGRTTMSRDDLRQAIFGSFDGLTSALGVITGLVVAGTHSGSRILAASLGLAIAATVGMGAGEYLSDESRSNRRALVMGGATLAGCMLPALPFAFGYGTVELTASGALTVAAALTIGHYRGYRLTLAILAVVAALTVAVTILVA